MYELEVALKIALANTFIMYFKSHSYHWNVEGIMFSQYHEFFGDLYEELHSAVDVFAEEIRATDAYAPTSLMDILKFATCTENTSKPLGVRDMVTNLLTDNIEVTASLNKAFILAQSNNNQGLMDFIAGRLDVHAKYGWMLRSSVKGFGEQQ